jgi:hypothetical protein
MPLLSIQAGEHFKYAKIGGARVDLGYAMA